MDDITEDYRTSLADLTRNSKQLITMLTMLAGDNETHAAKIVDVIETHLQQTSAEPETASQPGGEATALNTQLAASQTEPMLIVYSPGLAGLAYLEKKLISSLANSSSSKRGRNLKYSFNYLLLDPRVTKNLPSRMNSLGDQESFKVFVAAIFYVGKGRGTRPYRHLHETLKQRRKKTTLVSNKEKRIREIWSENVGVVLLHCFQNVISKEALTREACMIDAISLNRLTNENRGSYYGISKTWSETQRRNMGIHLLKKTFQIFQAEGEKPILPDDIKVRQ